MTGKGISYALSVCFIAASVLAACSKTEQTQQPAKDSGQPIKAQAQEAEIKPITLKVYAGMPDSEFKNQIKDPMSRKYPQITLERIGADKKAITLDQLITAGETPDLIFSPKDEIKSNMMRLGLQYDLTDLIKKYNYDLKRFDPVLMRTIQDLSGNGQLYGLPQKKTLYGLVYNKEIFDKFGIPYPKDGMTWDETIELAKQVTKLENDIQYRGLDFNNISLFRGQLSQPYIDKNDKAAVTTPQWQTIARTYQSIFAIPGNIGDKSGYDVFLKDRTVAMFASGLLGMINRATEVPDLKWDMVTFPTFKEAPNTDPQADGTTVAITSTSKLKEEAFQVIRYLLSDEVQIPLVRDGFLTTLNNEEIHKQLGANQPLFKGKNLQAAYKNKLSSLPTHQYDYVAGPIISKTFDETIKKGGADINTALRSAEELINKGIASEKAK